MLANPGGMTTSGGSGAGGVGVPFFGFQESKGAGSLVGKFCDLKQLKNQTPSKLDEQNGFPSELSKFVNSGWNEANLQNILLARILFTLRKFLF
jgi:hypothetical protein